jgi:surface antigen
MNDIAYVNSIKSLQTTVSERNVYLFHSLKNLWSPISKTVAVIGILSKMKMKMQQYDEKLYYTRQCVFFLYDWQKFLKTNIVTCSYSII